MKHTPISEETLDKKTWLSLGFGEVEFLIVYPRGRAFMRTYRGTCDQEEDFVTQVRDLEEEYGSKFKDAASITLFFNAPLWDKLYEYNNEDGQWYLVKNGQGFA